MKSSGRPNCYVLIDYDNIDRAMRAKGLYWLTGRILEKIADSSFNHFPRFIFRLYGGWYERSNLTRSAQDLSLAISRDVPGVFPVVSKGSQFRVGVKMELAYSLAIQPSRPLLATYRPRSIQNTISCREPSAVGCTQRVCELGTLYSLFRTQKCANPGCGIGIEEILFKAEQKLVDSMIFSDLIFFSQNAKSPVTIVTSDDDLWPGIFHALQLGANVNHVRTRPLPRNHYGYMTNLPANYKVTTLS